MTLRRVGRLGQRAYVVIGIGLVVAVVVTELRKPSEQRTWQGYVAGVIPYNFRRSQGAEPRHSLWNPDTDQVLVPRGFGIGWSINFAAVVRKVRRAINERRVTAR